MSRLRVLLVDDEPDMVRACRQILEDAGPDVPPLEIEAETDARSATRRISESEPFQILLVDLRMPGLDGIELIRIARRRDPDTMGILMTAYATVQSAVETLRLGGFDYITKPFTAEELQVVFRRALDSWRLRDENRFLREQLARPESAFLGASPAAQGVLALAERYAEGDSTILIVGETGTGKSLLARHIHKSSRSRDGPFVLVDCAVLPESLLESEVFGHEKGAFTGASSGRRGLLEFAGRGTLFLDDIAEMPLPLQSKLLGVLQERSFRRIGSNEGIRVEARFIAATNRDPFEDVRARRLREDLYFRLNVLRLDVPPLRERVGDVVLLARTFIERYGRSRGILGFDPEAEEALGAHAWPGNVRELQNAVERACALARGPKIALEDLPSEISAGPPGKSGASDFVVAREAVLGEFERDYFRKLFEASKGNITAAAERSGLSRNTLYAYARKQGLDPETFR